MIPFTSNVEDRFDDFVERYARATRRDALWTLRAASGALRERGLLSLAGGALDSCGLADWWEVRCRRWGGRTRKSCFLWLKRYYHWLYTGQVIPAYALRHTPWAVARQGRLVRIRLGLPLQREIDQHVDGLGLTNRSSLNEVRRILLDFERFCNVRGTRVDRRTVVAWLRERARRFAFSGVHPALGVLRRFLEETRPPEASRLNPAKLPIGLSAQRVIQVVRSGQRVRLSPLPEINSVLTPWWKRFVRLKRRLGYRYRNREGTYRRFDRFLYPQGITAPAHVTARHVSQFLSRPSLSHPNGVHQEHQSLQVLFRYLVSRGVLARNPAALLGLRRMPSRPPHVFSHEEIRHLLQAARGAPPPGRVPQSLYVMLHLLYACGLRRGELLRLELGDVDLAARLLRIRQTKFFKDRLVPFNARVAENLRTYLAVRLRLYPPRSDRDPFFMSGRRRALAPTTLADHFRAVLRRAGLCTAEGARAPSLHGLRHAFAVHRVMRWYRQGADVTRKLALLSTYMGHARPEDTQIYLTMTPSLMRTASRRFLDAFEAASGPTP